MENVLKENDRLLTHVLSVEIVNIVVHDCMNVNCLNVDACAHCVTTESELKTDFIKKECYETLLQQYHILETHYISLEVNNKLNTEIFQRDTVSSLESAPTFAELFEINDLKAQVQEKDTVILKLKEKLKSFSGDVKERKVEREVEEIETQNLELDHKVTKLSAKNEHLIQTYKQLFDSIKFSRVQSKEQCDDLINKVNLKFVEVSDLNASLQEKVLVITALKEQLNKLKGKAVLTKSVSLNPIDPALLQVDVAPLVPKLRKNRTAHTDYIRHAQEEAATLREIVESERLLRVNLVSSASGALFQDNTKHNRIQRTQKKAKKNKIEDHLRTVKSSLNKESVVDSKATSSVINSVTNVNSDLKCASCNGCLLSNNHDACVVAYINSVNASKKSKSVNTPVKRKAWKTIGKVFKSVGHIWKPTGRIFTLVGNVFPLNRIATPTIVHPREPIPIVNSTDKLVVTLIMGYGDYQIGNVTISRVYYVEGLGHNLFSVGQFCDSDLEVAFRQHTSFIRNLDGVDLLMGSRGNNLYTLSIQDMMASSPICLLSKASKTKSWLWHRRLSHLNFGAINHLARQELVRGLSKLKFEMDHLCSACATGKSTRKTHKPKYEHTNQEKLYLLHMDLCGPMSVESINGKKYILVIMDDYSRFTWVKFLRSKDKTLDFIIKFLKMIQVRLKVSVRRIRIDNGTEFVNQTLRDYYEEVGISHETSVARSLQQNGVVERQAMATACFTQNRSIIRLRHGKTPYELLHNKLPDLSFFHVFGALCYPTNDSENLAIAPITEAIPPGYVDSIGSPSLTTVEQYAPSTSNSPTPTETQSLVIPQDVRDDNRDMEVAHMGNDLLFGVPILEVTSA
uniref:Retrovirus-related Pol polyprotein from transposon TNT 1-94 n=1 Tax=Tanacetum cinerariifolium TaxID=118510 RepID=A0A6L2N035_TANCI|nr:retrovirus-related Pol polyprotein from transposon TNT 1-94 [Tanacetum cinerariifolium]